MRASESPFQTYKSKRILSFASLICSSVSGHKALKKCVRFTILSCSEKLWNVFDIVLEKCEVFVQKSLSLKNISKEKIRRQGFTVYVFIYPLALSKFGGNRTNSLWVLAFYNVRFKWKNWFEKTALNMSIRRVIFTSGQNLKPLFLCQYLIFFNDFFFTLEISFGSLL